MTDTLASVTNLPVGLREGDIVAGRYRLEKVIGRGGMGVVVSAHHLELGERVAVKFLSPHALSNPEAVSRFDREVRAAARLRNEHIARVYDAGKLPDGGRYMVLEYLDGEDLAARVRRVGPLSPEISVRYLLQACTAVLEAHGYGIIHRDIKPANLFVVRRTDGTEVVKILDFGVMKRLSGAPTGTEPQQTEPGIIVGTPLYTSPEQLRGSASVDARTDIWSIGATLFELLSGTPPFAGKTYAQIIANVLESEPPRLRALCPQLPQKLEAVVLRCLEKSPEDRYENIAELAIALSETMPLDAEQQGLLDRIARNRQTSSPFASTTSLSPTPRPLPEFAQKAESRTLPSPTRRLLVFATAATLSAAAVILLGLPSVSSRMPSPRHLSLSTEVEAKRGAPIGGHQDNSLVGRSSPNAPGVASVPLDAGALAERSGRAVDSVAGGREASVGASPLATPSTDPQGPSSNTVTNVKPPVTSTQLPLSRVPTKSLKHATDTKKTEPILDITQQPPPVEKKNPLLVRPR